MYICKEVIIILYFVFYFIGCIKEFSRIDKLKLYIVIYSGVRLFKCGECGRCFSRKLYLIEYERGYRADYKFKC